MILIYFIPYCYMFLTYLAVGLGLRDGGLDQGAALHAGLLRGPGGFRA